MKRICEIQGTSLCALVGACRSNGSYFQSLYGDGGVVSLPEFWEGVPNNLSGTGFRLKDLSIDEMVGA